MGSDGSPTEGQQVGAGAADGALLTAATRAAAEVIAIEAAAVADLGARLGSDFRRAVGLLHVLDGHVVVTGLGKSGHIGAKIAATLASTGTPAFFVHAVEALHGDAGMLAPGSALVAISNSGETAEVCEFAALARRRGHPVVAMTARPESTLARVADAVLDIAVTREADPLDLAPTASTTATLAFGDALAAALMVLDDFQAEDFHRHHPAGALGRRLAVAAEEGTSE